MIVKTDFETDGSFNTTTSDSGLKYFYGVAAQPSPGHRSRDTGSEAAPGQHSLASFFSMWDKNNLLNGEFFRDLDIKCLRTVTGPMFIDGAEARLITATYTYPSLCTTY